MVITCVISSFEHYGRFLSIFVCLIYSIVPFIFFIKSVLYLIALRLTITVGMQEDSVIRRIRFSVLGRFVEHVRRTIVTTV